MAVVARPKITVNADTETIVKQLEVIATVSSGAECFYSTDQTIWTKFEGPLLLTENGIYYFKAVNPTNGLESSSYTILEVNNIDNVGPTLEISCDTHAPTNRSVTLTATASDGIIEYFINDEWVVGDSFSVSENGTYKFRATDTAGNVTEKSFVVKNIDKIAPTLEITGNVTEWTNQDVVLTANASDGIIEYFNGSEWIIGNSLTVTENGTYQFRATDEAGNVRVQEVVVDKIDKIGPTAPQISVSNDGKNVTVSHNGVIDTGSGAARQYVIEISTSSDFSTIYKSYGYSGGYSYSKIFLDDGVFYFRMKGEDAVGNKSPYSNTVMLQIDTTAPDAPTAYADITAPANTNVTVSATFSDDTVVKEYSLDGQIWSAYTDGVVFEDNGKIYFRGTDAAGNVSDVTMYEVSNIDKIAPTLEITGNVTEWTNQDVVLTANASDGTVEYFNGTEWIIGNSLTVTENGTYQFRATDEAGNVVSQEVVVDKIDKAGPTLKIIDTLVGDEVQLSAVSDEGTVEYFVDGTWVAGNSLTVAEGGIYQFRVADTLGNVTEKNVVVVTKNPNAQTPPSIGDVLIVCPDGRLPRVTIAAGVSASIYEGAEPTSISANAGAEINGFLLKESGTAFSSKYPYLRLSHVSIGKGDTGNVYAGNYITNIEVSEGGNLFVHDHGVVSGVTVSSGASITLCSGAVLLASGANIIASGASATIQAGAWGSGLSVEAGAKINGFLLTTEKYLSPTFTISGASVNAGETGTIYGGQRVSSIQIAEGGHLVISEGGRADDVTFAQNGFLTIESGGWLSDSHTLSSGVTAAIYVGAFFDSLTLYAGATVNGFTLNNNNTLYDSELYISDATVGSGNTGIIYAGQKYDYVRVDEGGNLAVRKNGYVSNLTVSSGSSVTFEDGAFFASLEISAGATINNFTFNSGTTLSGIQDLSNAGVEVKAGSTGIIYAGQMYGTVRVADGGNLAVRKNGSANRISAASGSSVVIESGALFDTLTVDAGAQVNGFTFNSGRSYSSDGNGMVFSGNLVVIKAGDTGTVYAGQRVSGIQIEEGGCLVVKEGGTIGSMTLTPGCTAIIENGVSFSSLRVNAGVKVNGFTFNSGRSYSSDGNGVVFSGSSTVIKAGDTGTVYAGQSVSGIQIEEGGHLIVKEGGTISNMTLTAGSSLTLEEGALFDALSVRAGATINGIILSQDSVFNNNVLNIPFITVGAGENVTLFDGQTAESLQISNGGHLTMENGSQVGEITVSDNSSITIHADADFNTLTVKSGAEVNGFYVSNQATFSDSTLNINGAFVYANDTGLIYDGQVVSELKITGGSNVIVHDGGTANNVTLFAGGAITIHDGALFDSIQVHSGAEVNGFTLKLNQNTLTANILSLTNATVNTGDTGELFDGQSVASVQVSAQGHLVVHNGGTAEYVTVNQSGSLTVEAGGSIKSSCQINHGSVTIHSGASIIDTLSVSAGAKVNGFTVKSSQSYSDSALSISHGVVYAGDVGTVFAGQSAKAVEVACGGQMEIFDGAEASSVTVSVGGALTVHEGGTVNSGTVESGGSATMLDNAAGSLSINQGAKFNGFSIDSGTYFSQGFISRVCANTGDTGTVYAGQTVGMVEIRGGQVIVRENGTVRGAYIEAGSLLLQGTLDLASTPNGFYCYNAATVQVDGGKIALSARNYSLNCSRIQGITNETISVSVDAAAPGEYVLLSSYAGDFDTITVVNEGLTVGQISVDGSALQDDMFSYELVSDSSKLSLVIKDILLITAPVITGVSTTNLTNQDVIITLSVAENAETNEYSLDGSNWYTFSEKVTAAANGSYYFRSTDAAGNVSDVTVYEVKNIDKIAPTLEITGNVTEWTNQDVILTANASDGTVEYFNGTEWIIGNSLTVTENGTYQFRATDEAGNVVSQEVVVDKIDKIIPTAPTAYADITAPANTNVTVSATFSDDTVVKEYSLDGQIWSAYTDGVVFEDNGKIYFRGTDAAGNVSDVTMYEVSNIDKIAPTLEITGNVTEWTNQDVVLTANASDGIIEYFNGTEWIIGNSLTVTENGTYQFRATDEAGNVVSQEVVVDKIDKIIPTAPTAYADITAPANTNVTVSATFSDDTVVKEYSLDGQIWSVYTDGVVFEDNGKIYFRGTDAAGNVSDVTMYEVSNIDKIAPTLEITGNVTEWTNQDVVLTANASDGTVEYFNGTEWVAGTSLTVTENGTYQFRATDAAGNVVTREIVVDKIDKVVVPQNPHGTADGLSWQGTNYADNYQVELGTKETNGTVSIETSKTGVDFYTSAENTFIWKVSADNGESVSGNEIVISGIDPQKFTSESNGLPDLFIAGSNGIWDCDYVAQHLGLYEEWEGNNEFVELAGKNILADIFEGSTDANILIMTDDANGDALFVDDVYTALPGTVLEQQARIARIDEIRAGLGDDIVDMTSQQFAYAGDGIKIYGGLGDDTIWANKGDNTLFGDAGNDRIVGGSGNDVIIGGDGNDSMHGGGGNDLFCFCNDWGTDSIEQLTGGKITLWFKSGEISNWDASTFTYTEGANSVQVIGVVNENITLIFGDNGSSLYDDLTSAGCFAAAASEKIFEDNKGQLA